MANNQNEARKSNSLYTLFNFFASKKKKSAINFTGLYFFFTEQVLLAKLVKINFKKFKLNDYF